MHKAQEGPSQRLLGSRIIQSVDGDLSWTSKLKLEDEPWLSDQILLGSKTFPIAGYIAMAGESMRQLTESKLQSFSVKDFSISTALFLGSVDKIELHTKLHAKSLDEEKRQWYRIEISYCNETHLTELCTGLVASEGVVGTGILQDPVSIGTARRSVTSDYWYGMIADRGIEYGASQKGLSDISVVCAESKASATITPVLEATNSVAHPIFIDYCLQVSMIAACRGQGRLLADLYVITSIQHLIVSNNTWDRLTLNGAVSPGHLRDMSYEFSAVNENGLPTLSGQCTISPISNFEQHSDSNLFSFTKWQTDSTYHNLNNLLAPVQSDLDSGDVQNDEMLADALRLLGHKNPKLNILEFGGATKGSTNRVLKAVRTQFDEPLYSSYLFASTSAIAVTNSEESLKEYKNVRAIFFDAAKSIEQQGMKAGFYDLVIITDLVKLANNAKIIAKILRRLLHPQGYVVLLDGVPELEQSSISKSYLTRESPNASTGSKTKSFFEDVCAVLLENDFVFDDQNNESLSAPKVFARLKHSVSTTLSEITVVGPAYHLPLVREVEKTFEKHNIQCVKSTIDGKKPPGRDLMVFVDFDEPYLYNVTEAELSQLVKLVSSMKAKIIWVTPSAQISCKNPNSSLILGLMRTIRSEFKKDITVVELEPKRASNVSLSRSLLKIYEGLSHRIKSKDLDCDYEYAIVDGEIKIPRLQWTTANAEYAHIAARSPGHNVSTRTMSPRTGKVPESVQFRPECCYVLVGGLGGLGRMISTWMVENGARNIVFFSRSAREGPETTPFFDELRTQGCTVVPFAGSVTNLLDVEELVKQAKTPIAGIIQMSAVMRDNLMSQMTFSDWRASVEPKVQGTWNLHHATSAIDLDFFLLFSSICGITGQWGQGNYNAANAFLDAFVNYRHGLNLAASVVDIGFMGSIGMAVESEALVKHLKGSGYHYLNERDLIDALTISLANSRPEGDKSMHRSQLGLGIRSTKPMTSPTCRVVWKKDSRMAISHHLEPIGGIGQDGVKNLLNQTYGMGAHCEV